MKSKLLIISLTVLILTGQAAIAGQKRHTAVEPDHRHSWWTLRNDAVNERVKQGNVGLLMIGDSISDRRTPKRRHWPRKSPTVK